MSETRPLRTDTVVIGAGQAGLSVGHFLAERSVPFVILDSNERVGDSWRRRWDSLKLFTPARLDGLPGLPFPSAPDRFPTKDEMAAYLESYARHFRLPVRNGVSVTRVSRRGGPDESFLVETNSGSWEARNVVVAMAGYQEPRVPALAKELAGDIVQLHSKEYRNPTQLRGGSVLVVGAGNSGAEIAIELRRAGRPVWLSGNETGNLPFRIDSFVGRLLQTFVLRFVFHRVLTLGTPIGRRARPAVLAKGAPLIRQQPSDLEAAGIRRVPKVSGTRGGLPVLEDGRALQVENVVWCTGFHPGFSWIDLPAFGPDGKPLQERGVSAGVPGLYFVGLTFLYAMSSSMVHGVSRDAAHVAEHIAQRATAAVAVTRDGRIARESATLSFAPRLETTKRSASGSSTAAMSNPS
jgi:putative flavoprotein involved in K+ transport